VRIDAVAEPSAPPATPRLHEEVEDRHDAESQVQHPDYVEPRLHSKQIIEQRLERPVPEPARGSGPADARGYYTKPWNR
jgi:hypothetical protein